MPLSTASGIAPGNPNWPALPFSGWKDTCATLHMWTQIVGKVRLVQTPWLNHSWHVPFYLTARGLTTSPMPYGERTFEVEFDFIDHLLRISTSDGLSKAIGLQPKSVARFYREFFACLDGLGLAVRIRTTPNEVPVAIPFEQDETHASYDAAAVNRFWHALLQADRVLKQFRSRFLGKCSPVHFFWGSFDLAVTRFSGAPAPEHPGGVPNCPDWVTRDAYSHEVCSCGFWPGGEAMPMPVFYAYAYPEPAGFKTAPIRPAEASYEPSFGEFILPYEVVRRASQPDAVLLDFFQSSYEAAADLAKWRRSELDYAGAHPRRAGT
ncbi:MAG TPA: DUF5996 family protein [Telluria sp.]